MNQWIVVANEADCVIYFFPSVDELCQVTMMHNEAGRQKTAELVSDRDGRSFDSQGQGRHTMGREEHGPRQEAAEGFARDIVARINQAFDQGEIESFVLIAAPRFLGVLRKSIDARGRAQPKREIDKDIVAQGLAGVTRLLKIQA
jgi:protein required for attachment to host cells